MVENRNSVTFVIQNVASRNVELDDWLDELAYFDASLNQMARHLTTSDIIFSLHIIWNVNNVEANPQT